MAAKIDSFEKMHIEEIEERARMFRNLSRSRGYAAERIMQNIRWEFEHRPSPSLEKRVAEIIARVYKD